MRKLVILGFCVIIGSLFSVIIKMYMDSVWHRTRAFDKTSQETNGFVKSEMQSYGVIGILSADKHIELRDMQRKIFSTNTQSNVFIRFLLDRPTEDTLKESRLHSDIIFLNASSSGYAVRFGEKLYKWFTITTKLFPDAKFVGKMDDDVYICDTSFKIIWENWSALMYLGWAHNFGWKNISRKNRIDEMFVIVGRELVKRIIKRQYCYGKNQCNSKKDLYDNGYADVSLAIWLSVYDDVYSVQINRIVIQAAKANYNPGMCRSYFLLHTVKSSKLMNAIYHDQQSMVVVKSPNNVNSSGVNGQIFLGKRTRKYNGPILDVPVISVKWRDNMTCSFWGVITTVHPVSKAIEKVSREMCLVIVADLRTPEETYNQIRASKTVKFLSVNDQNILMKSGLEIIEHIPWNNFGRKNIGYLYAIMHGAQRIFDFDDDNLLIRAFPEVNEFTEWYVSPDVRIFNPYPSFITLEEIAWPRGFPLSNIKISDTWKPLNKMYKKSITMSKIGVIQSLANNDPDVDAIWRLTRKLPITFNNNAHLIILSRTLSPYNAQATLCFALWGLLLPVSVHGRVADIWRSYITQRLMWDIGQFLGFVSPFVRQVRNFHNHKADFNSELPLYEKTEALLDVVQSWKGTSRKFEERILELYIELYEREFIEYSDILLVQAWIRSLKQINYTFPSLDKSIYT